MTKKVFAGWGVPAGKVAGSVEDWFRKKGYEAQAAGAEGRYVVQARKTSTWRTLLGNSQSMVVQVESTPAGLAAEFGAGTWAKNLKESGAAGVAGAVAAWMSLGLTALQAAGERSGVEAEFWAAMEVGCRGCGGLGAGIRTGETVVGMSSEPGTEIGHGMLKGVQTYVENYRCTKCEAIWSGGEKRRTLSLCPGCQQPCKPAETGETVIRSFKEREASPGVFEGWLVYRRHFRCPGCSHAWAGPEVCRRVKVCPACEKPVAGAENRWEVTGTVTRTEMILSKDEHYRDDGGLLSVPKQTGVTIRQHPVQVRYEVSARVFRCEHCSHEWTGGERERRLG